MVVTVLVVGAFIVIAVPVGFPSVACIPKAVLGHECSCTYSTGDQGTHWGNILVILG